MKLSKIILGTSTLLLFFTSCGDQQNSTQPATSHTYPTLVVQMESTQLESVYPATIKGQEDIEIRPRIDGFVDAIYVDEGSVVKKGQPLFKIDSPQAEQAFTNAEATLKSAQAQVNTAKVNVNRIRPLAEKGIVSHVQLETAEDSYQSALAGLAQAEAALKNAKATLGWTSVTSPVDGLVGSIPLRQGSLVNSANILTTIANTKNVYAYFSLNEKELSSFLQGLEGDTQAEKIKNTPAVTLILADGTTYTEKGRIETITGSINITTGSANFRVSFPNPAGLLRSGTSGKVSIPKEMNDVTVIPQKATFSQQDKTILFQVQGDSVVQKAVSVVPTPDGKSYVVTSGVQAGERIVTDGIATLYHGKKISFQ